MPQITRLITASVKAASQRPLAATVSLKGGNYVGNGDFKYGNALFGSNTSVLNEPGLKIQQVSDGPGSSNAYVLRMTPSTSTIANYVGENTYMVCGNTTFETKAWIRCSSNFNGNKALLQTSFFDSNKIEVGASKPSFPTKCDNSWQEVKTSYDSKGKSICSFKVVVATDLKHTKGTSILQKYLLDRNL